MGYLPIEIVVKILHELSILDCVDALRVFDLPFKDKVLCIRERKNPANIVKDLVKDKKELLNEMKNEDVVFIGSRCLSYLDPELQDSNTCYEFLKSLDHFDDINSDLNNLLQISEPFKSYLEKLGAQFERCVQTFSKSFTLVGTLVNGRNEIRKISITYTGDKLLNYILSLDINLFQCYVHPQYFIHLWGLDLLDKRLVNWESDENECYKNLTDKFYNIPESCYDCLAASTISINYDITRRANHEIVNLTRYIRSLELTDEKRKISTDKLYKLISSIFYPIYSVSKVELSITDTHKCNSSQETYYPLLEYVDKGFEYLTGALTNPGCGNYYLSKSKLLDVENNCVIFIPFYNYLDIQNHNIQINNDIDKLSTKQWVAGYSSLF